MRFIWELTSTQQVNRYANDHHLKMVLFLHYVQTKHTPHEQTLKKKVFLEYKVRTKDGHIFCVSFFKRKA